MVCVSIIYGNDRVQQPALVQFGECRRVPGVLIDYKQYAIMHNQTQLRRGGGKERGRPNTIE